MRKTTLGKKPPIRRCQTAPDLFRNGNYLPLHATGADANSVVSYARQTADDAVIVIAPRLVLSALSQGRPLLNDTTIALPSSLANQRYVDILTDREWELENDIPVSKIIKPPYIALLRKQ